MRDTVLADGHEFSVDNGIALNAFQSLCDLDIIMADDLAVAAIERDTPVLDGYHHAKSIILVFEYPTRIVERRIREGGEHGLQSFRQCRDARHASPFPLAHCETSPSSEGVQHRECYAPNRCAMLRAGDRRTLALR